MGLHIADRIGNAGGTLTGVLPGLSARSERALGCDFFATPDASFGGGAMIMRPAQNGLIDAQVATPDRVCKAREAGQVPGAPEFHAAAFANALVSKSLESGSLMGSNWRQHGEAEMQDHDDR